MSFQGVPFSSVLFEGPRQAAGTENAPTPDFFRDLHLDQVVAWILARRQDYKLTTFFYSSLRETNAVRYRQEVCQDLDKDEVADCVRAFAERMRRARSFLKGMSQIETLYFKQGWFLDAAESYWWAVTNLLDGLGRLPLRSRGLNGLKEYLDSYTRSERFVALGTEIRQLRSDLAEVHYCERGRRSDARSSRR
jgi:DNA mismatch repair protein MutS